MPWYGDRSQQSGITGGFFFINQDSNEDDVIYGQKLLCSPLSDFMSEESAPIMSNGMSEG